MRQGLASAGGSDRGGWRQHCRFFVFFCFLFPCDGESHTQIISDILKRSFPFSLHVPKGKRRRKQSTQRTKDTPMTEAMPFPLLRQSHSRSGFSRGRHPPTMMIDRAGPLAPEPQQMRASTEPSGKLARTFGPHSKASDGPRPPFVDRRSTAGPSSIQHIHIDMHRRASERGSSSWPPRRD